jgi:hypothetical protein
MGVIQGVQTKELLEYREMRTQKLEVWMEKVLNIIRNRLNIYS